MTASTPRKKNEPATPFQCPCKYFAGAFYYRLRICSATARRGENRSKSYFILGIRRKKFPNSNPKAKSAPTLYFSRNFPLFPAISRFQTHPSNITELSGRFVSSKKLAGFLKNPLFNNYSWGMTPSIAGVIPVARLDGAARADAEGLVKSAIEAEKRGIAGRVYIDKSKREKTGDRWLDAAAKILSAAGFDVSENSEPGLFGCADRMDAPAFYFGWYTFRPCGYFAEKGFSFPRGASALHIYSFSASDMRNAANWTPAFVSKGAAAVFGNVYEPYLGGTHHPHVYALALARGMSSGEAASAAMPFLSWQGVFVGDPLFKPFKTGLDAQMRAIDSGSADALSQYSVIRVMNRIAREKGAAAAFDFGSKYVGKFPDGALLWKLSQTAAAEGNSAESVRLASDALGRDLYSEASNRGLAMEICRYLIPRGGAPSADPAKSCGAAS